MATTINRNPFLKKIMLVAGGILGLLLLALFLLPIIYQSTIEKIAKEEINKKTTAFVSFDHATLSFYKDFPNPTVSLHDLTIIGEYEFANDTLTYTKEASIEVSLWSLFFGKGTDLKSIHLKDAYVALKVLKNGDANYTIFKNDSLSQNDTSSSVNLAIDKFILSNGTFVYKNDSSNTYVRLAGIDHVGKGDFMKEIFDYETVTKIKNVNLVSNKTNYIANKEMQIDMVLEMNLKNNSYQFKENLLRINHFQVALHGYFTLLEDGIFLDLKFGAKETAFKNILSLIPGIYMRDFNSIETKGDIAFDGFVKGKLADSTNDTLPAFHLDMKIKDAMFKVDTLPNPIENIQMELILDNAYGILDSTTILCKNLNATIGKNPIHGNFSIHGIKKSAIQADLKASLELAEIESIYPIKGIDLKGLVNVNLIAKGNYIQGKKEPLEIPSFTLEANVMNGRVKYDSVPAAIHDIQLQLSAANTDGKLSSTSLNFKSIHLNLGENPIHGYARIEGYNDYLVDADIKAKLNLADVEKIYPLENKTLKGLFKLDVKTKGLYSPSKKKFPSVDAKINLENGYVLTSNYPTPITDIHLIAEAINKTGEIKDTKLSISNLTYSLDNEPFEIKGTVEDFENYFYDLKIKGKIDLGKISKVYPVEGIALSGIISSDIETKGSIKDLEDKHYEKTSSDGKIEISNLKLSGSKLPLSIGIKDALFTFTPTKIILNKLEGKLGRGNIKLTGDLYNYMAFITSNGEMIRGDLNLVCDTLNLNPLLASKNKNGKIDTTGSTINFFEVPRNMEFVFDSYIHVLRYEDMIIKKMKGEIKIKDGVLVLKETGFSTLNASFKVNGEYSTRNPKHPFFAVLVDIKELDINRAYKEIKFIRDLAPAMADTYGIFSLSYKLIGELDKSMSPKTETLRGSGTIRVAEAKVNGMKIFEEISKSAKKKEINDPHVKDLVVDTEIKNNQLLVRPFSLSINGYEAEVEGINDLSGTINYIVRLELLSLDKLKIPFHITGTYDNPKVALGKGHKLPEE